jgi:hypothetical protein
MSLQFCEDSLSWSDLFSDFSAIYDKYQEIDEVSPLQGVALARELSDAIDSFKEKIAMVSMKSLICAVLKNIDIDKEVEEVTKEIEDFFSEFSGFDEAIASIKSDGFETLEDIENAVKPIFENFNTTKETIEKEIAESLKLLFSPLLELGATQEQIDTALEDVQLQENPIQIIIDTFMEIAQSTLNGVD